MTGPCDPLKAYIESKLPAGFVVFVDFDELHLTCTISERGTARFSFRQFPFPKPDGVGVASQPKARLSRDGFTVEITRVATDGHRNACSKLYGALMRASAAIGYRKAITFTRIEEPGTSLRAAGFADDGLTRDQSWSRPSRGRGEHTSQVRRWVRALGCQS